MSWNVAGCAMAVFVTGAISFFVLALYLIGSKNNVFTPAFTDQARGAANLKKIGDAMQKYVEENGHFPPAFTVDEQGQPLHSWRVLLLPQLGYEELYDEFDLDQPWNHPTNLQATAKMPDEYRCPADFQSRPDETSYVAIVGDGFLFSGNQPTKPEQITDGTALTLTVVESTGMGIPWTQPVDLTAQEAIWSPNIGQRGMGGLHEDGTIYLLTADGTVQTISEDATTEEIHAICTIAGSEAVYPRLTPTN